MGMEPGARIRAARRARTWSQKDLADRVGISQVAIQKIERGETVQSRHLPKIAQLLDLPLAELYPDLSVETVRDEADLEPVTMVGRDFPVYASAEGGDGEIIRSTDPVDWVPRPVPLRNVRGAYGLLVTGTSMEPEYRAGDTALVNPHLPPVGGEVHVFYSEIDGEARATIKHLRRASPDNWLVTQWNPPGRRPRDFVLSRKDWPVAHRVIGKYSRI